MFLLQDGVIAFQVFAQVTRGASYGDGLGLVKERQHTKRPWLEFYSAFGTASYRIKRGIFVSHPRIAVSGNYVIAEQLKILSLPY